MPYTPSSDNLPENVKKMNAGDRAQWCEVFNSAYEKCTKVGNDSGACEEDAFEIANGVVKGSKRMDIKELWESVKRLFAPLIEESGPTGNMFGTEIFGIYSRDDLVRATEYQVELPTQTRSLVVERDISGAYRWTMIAASAVVNKVGSIDSTVLFDSFIRKAPEVGYPVLDFLHEGERLRFGVADWLHRDGALYIASGTFDDSDLARAAAIGLEKDNGYWGASIAYRITAPPMLLIAEGEIPVYTDGINNFISVVPKRMAANLFTATSVTKEVKRMDKQVFDELVKLVGAERAAQFAGDVDDANRIIAETGMVMRAEVSTMPEAERAEQEEKVVTLDPAGHATKHSAQVESFPAPIKTSAIETRADPPAADTPQAEPSLADVITAIKALADRVTALEQGQSAARTDAETEQKRATDTLTDLTTRLSDVETIKQRWLDWLNDAPEYVKTEADKVYRARNQPVAQPTMEQVASQTTSKMKTGAQPRH